MKNNLAKIRTQKGLTAEELAEISGVPFEEVQAIENNSAKTVKIGTLQKLADSLSCKITDIFNAEPETIELTREDFSTIKWILGTGREKEVRRGLDLLQVALRDDIDKQEMIALIMGAIKLIEEPISDLEHDNKYALNILYKAERKPGGNPEA